MSLVETISIEDGNSNKKTLKLQTDPLNSHCIYAIVSSPSLASSSVYAILSKWIFNAMNDKNDNSNDNHQLESSVLLPIYDDDINSKVCCGIIITFDSILGHCVIIRFISGHVIYINISAHMAICEFQNTVNTIDKNNKSADDSLV